MLGQPSAAWSLDRLSRPQCPLEGSQRAYISFRLKAGWASPHTIARRIWSLKRSRRKGLKPKPSTARLHQDECNNAGARPVAMQDSEHQLKPEFRQPSLQIPPASRNMGASTMPAFAAQRGPPSPLTRTSDDMSFHWALTPSKHGLHIGCSDYVGSRTTCS